jgi:hypothetical protein
MKNFLIDFTTGVLVLTLIIIIGVMVSIMIIEVPLWGSICSTYLIWFMGHILRK